MRLPQCKRIDIDADPTQWLKNGWREIEEFITYEREPGVVDHEPIAITNFWDPFIPFPFDQDRLHRDPLVPDQVADAFKRKCIERASRKKWPLLTYGNMGFLIMRPSHDASVIDLMGVLPGMRRQGIGKILVSAFINQSVHLCRAGTQAHNPACRLYESMGFRAVKRERTFHK